MGVVRGVESGRIGSGGGWEVELSGRSSWRWNANGPLSEIRWNSAGSHAGRLGVGMGVGRERERDGVRAMGEMWEMEGGGQGYGAGSGQGTENPWEVRCRGGADRDSWEGKGELRD